MGYFWHEVGGVRIALVGRQHDNTGNINTVNNNVSGVAYWRTPPVNFKLNQELKKEKEKYVGQKSFRLDDLFLHRGKRGGTDINGIAVSGVDTSDPHPDPVRDRTKQVKSMSVIRT